jgi:hypothetical protein
VGASDGKAHAGNPWDSVPGGGRYPQGIANAGSSLAVSTSNHDVKSIVRNLIEHMDKFQDWDNPQYYNIETLKLLASNGLRAVAEVSR